MKITDIETYSVSAGWKNWLFLRVLTDEGLHGTGEATINGFIKTTEAAVHELKQLVIGKDPLQVNAVKERLAHTVQDAGHIHRLATAGIEVACWDILGKSLGVPVYQLLGGKHRDSILAYANGWYRAERTAEDFIAAAESVAEHGFRAAKLDPFGLAQGTISRHDLQIAREILLGLREKFGADFEIMIDVHTRFNPRESIRVAEKLADLDLYWWEEPTKAEREVLTNQVAEMCSIPVATGEQFDSVGQFFTLAEAGGVSIFQPEPMSLGGITNTIAVANIAHANACWIAPHQSGGPVATAVCLQLAAAIPNFLIQEHFDAFNEPWAHELVSWNPVINRENGHLPIPVDPGLGIELNLDVIAEHPYDPNSYFDVHEDGWERRLGVREQNQGKKQ